MNIMTKKKSPAKQPLCFITPDELDADALKACFPQKYLDRYHIHCVTSDQPNGGDGVVPHPEDPR